ncbi:MAG: peptidoglycan DD-metalloendopeptidase family protein [Chloroflexota bacterium]
MTENFSQDKSQRENHLAGAWEMLSQAGLAEFVLRLGTHTLLLAFIVLLAWGLREFYLVAQLQFIPSHQAVQDAVVPQEVLDQIAGLPAFALPAGKISGVARQASLHTDVPSRPRLEVVQYTVQAGDTLFGIADKFGLHPETILWANQPVLGDDPHNLRPGQQLNILPVDGTYYRWSAGDSLNGVSQFFGVQPQAIINFSGNHLDPALSNDWSSPEIAPGAWLVVPGGRREFVSWSVPEIPRDDPAAAKILGAGACGAILEGAVGSGTFIWPANNHFISGFDYNPSANHPGIDIDGNEGDPVYAADSGVVVYAGWNDWGYGNVVVIDHGNGWQTLYAHLSAIYASCGQSLWQGNILGAFGATGNATGAHLHFEMMFNGAKVNPHDYIK